MTEYPKSREELTAENNQLRTKVAELESFARQLEASLRIKDGEVQVLRRRRPPHVLDKDATDSFRRPIRR